MLLKHKSSAQQAEERLLVDCAIPMQDADGRATMRR